MKPIISYKAGGFFAPIDIPVVQKRISKKECRNYNDKQEFTDYVDSIKPSVRVDGYISILCSCGKEYDYVDKNEVPSSNLICDCGRRLIIYGS